MKRYIFFLLLLVATLCKAQSPTDSMPSDSARMSIYEPGRYWIDAKGKAWSLYYLRMDTLKALGYRWGWGGGSASGQPAPIPNDSLANSTISGIPLGSSLNPLSFGLWLSSPAGYNGSTARSVNVDSGGMASYFLRLNDSARYATLYYVLSHQTDTTHLSDRINLKLSISDTSSMLSHYLRSLDTLSLSNRVNLKVNIGDTTAMLAHFVEYGDTSNMLAHYFHTVDTAGKWLSKRDTTAGGVYPYTSNPKNYSTTTGTVTNIASGLWMNFSTITSTGTIAADSSTIAGYLIRRRDSTLVFMTPKQFTDSINARSFLTANQTITLSGDISGSGSTAITTAIGASKVTNAMLAGSIAYSKLSLTGSIINADLAGSISASKLVGTDIATVGTITSGTWHGTVLDTAYGGTGSSTTYGARTKVGVNTYPDLYSLLGSSIKSETVGLDGGRIAVTAGGVGNRQVAFALLKPLPGGMTLTGIMWYQGQKGAYIANNNNRIGLYKDSSATLVLVASCANDTSLLKTANSNTFATKDFSSTYVTVANTAYYAAILYCNSSQTTAPLEGSGTTFGNAGVVTLDFTNSRKSFSTLSSQNDIPSSVAQSGLTTTTVAFWFAVY